jgi:Tfp pilus assembly protein PilV
MAKARKPRATNASDWQSINASILAALDLQAEFAALGVEFTEHTPGPDGWLACWAVNRPHGNGPSAACNLKGGRYRDLGGSGASLSLWDLAVQQGRHSRWQDARTAYAAKAGVELPGDGEGSSRDPAEHLAFQPWNHVLAALFCRHKPGVTPEAIQAAGGRIARYRDQYSVVALPIFGMAGTEGDPVGWVIWNLTGKELPVWSKGQSKPTWVKMKTTGGSEAGWIGQHALNQLQARQSQQAQQEAAGEEKAPLIIWKTEGPSDALALFAAIPADLRSTHLPLTNAGGSNQQPRDWMTAAIAGHQVHVIHDADEPGQKGAEKWAQWAAGHAKEVRLVKLPYEVEKDHGRDLRDWLMEEVV